MLRGATPQWHAARANGRGPGLRPTAPRQDAGPYPSTCQTPKATLLNWRLPSQTCALVIELPPLRAGTRLPPQHTLCYSLILDQRDRACQEVDGHRNSISLTAPYVAPAPCRPSPRSRAQGSAPHPTRNPPLFAAKRYQSAALLSGGRAAAASRKRATCAASAVSWPGAKSASGSSVGPSSNSAAPAAR